MLGLKRHLPPFVVVAVTVGALPGYSVCPSNSLRNDVAYGMYISGEEVITLSELEVELRNITHQPMPKESKRFERTNLKESKLIRCIRRTDNNSLDISDIHVSTGNRKS